MDAPLKKLSQASQVERILTNVKYDDILDKDAILSSLLLVTISPALLWKPLIDQSLNYTCAMVQWMARLSRV